MNSKYVNVERFRNTSIYERYVGEEFRVLHNAVIRGLHRTQYRQGKEVKGVWISRKSFEVTAWMTEKEMTGES